MTYVLPEIKDDKSLEFPWFPTPIQCVVYRNWGTVNPHRIADALDVDVEDIMKLAEDMGLDTDIVVSDEWNTRGYITIIRNNWHLLSYKAICTLLGWTEEYLAFILKEDDFLDIKLGGFKPKTPEIKFVPLTEEQKFQTKRIKELTTYLRGLSVSNLVDPFDFFGNLTTLDKRENEICSLVFKDRIIYSYCALYGDVFLDEKLIDASFPDEMLKKYQECGINGVWTQGVLSALAPYPFDKNASRNCEKRIEGVNYLISKLKKYNIGLYIYFNEPRALPLECFEGKESIRGAIRGENACLCSSSAEVKEYLFGAVKYFVERVPGLRGIFTITASENLTNCYSHFKDGETTCPICKNRAKAEIIGEVNKIICEAAKSANEDIKIIAYTWGWEQLDKVRPTCEKMPRDISLMCVSEFDVRKTVEGEQTKVVDYSISVEGPGIVSKDVWKFAKDDGRETFAKLQMNNTWELSTVPMIPAFCKIYGHLRRLAELGTVDSLMLTWTLGGYPSPALKMLNYFRKDKIFELSEILNDIFPEENTELLLQAFKELSEAFDRYPFSVHVAYLGPQHGGPANLLYQSQTGFKATMVGYPYDDLDTWKGKFSLDAYKSAWENMCNKWHEGLKTLMKLESDNKDVIFIKQSAEACDIHFSSVLNQIKYVLARDNSERRSILDEEIKIVEKAIKLVDSNATIGYEASNHYFYTKQNLYEKMINCSYLKETIL